MQPRPEHPHASPPRRSSVEEINAVLAGTSYGAVRFLGRGRMGELWVIEHLLLRQELALKLMHVHLDGSGERMRLEAETLGRLNHPNSVAVVDYWVGPDGRPCIVMELLRGHTLWAELRERERLLPPEAADIASQALHAIGAAHTLGVVHRDVHPNNIFLHESPGYGRVVKVMDFGVVRVVPTRGVNGPAPLAQPTQSGAVVGSPRFMSPEAWRGERLDPRSDLYSMGLVLYEMLVGHGPFDGGEKVAAPPSRFAPGHVPPELDAIVLHAIAERREQRYQTASELFAALAPWRRAVPSSIRGSGI